jgi:hypothetical protein
LPNSSGDTEKNKNYFLAGARAQQAGWAAGAGARHCGAPMLRRYATTSALLLLMANLSAVLPPLQGR